MAGQCRRKSPCPAMDGRRGRDCPSKLLLKEQFAARTIRPRTSCAHVQVHGPTEKLERPFAMDPSIRPASNASA